MSSNTVLWGRSRNDLIKLAITVLLPLFIFLVPTNDVFTADFRLFPCHHTHRNHFFCYRFSATNRRRDRAAGGVCGARIAPGDVVFSAWLNYVPWMMIGALILSLVLVKKHSS